MNEIFKIKDFEMVWVGDSAGGTLLACLQSWLIINRSKGISLKFPKSLILNYPGILISSRDRRQNLLA